jgi:hypothetical protein
MNRWERRRAGADPRSSRGGDRAGSAGSEAKASSSSSSPVAPPRTITTVPTPPARAAGTSRCGLSPTNQARRGSASTAVRTFCTPEGSGLRRADFVGVGVSGDEVEQALALEQAADPAPGHGVRHDADRDPEVARGAQQLHDARSQRSRRLHSRVVVHEAVRLGVQPGGDRVRVTGAVRGRRVRPRT